MDLYFRKGAFAVAVFVQSPEGIPLVNDPKKPNSWWKFAGGNSEENEKPEDAAVREIYEELGFSLDKKKLQLLYKEDRKNHIFFLYKYDINSLKGLREEGDEREEIKVFSLGEMRQMQNFMPNHRRIIKKLGII
jgi:8-oxo-dGTP pyrophosphatase MutT (NUDIX family)